MDFFDTQFSITIIAVFEILELACYTVTPWLPGSQLLALRLIGEDQLQLVKS